MRKRIFLLGGLVLVVVVFVFSQKTEEFSGVEELPLEVVVEESGVVLPIAEFEERITKKPFGIYITPENSPVQPERFRGYHTGVDVEYEDVLGEVPVYSVVEGEIVFRDWVAGYGGVIVVKSADNLFFFYGHLDQGSFVQGKTVGVGEQLGVLGEGGTRETDYERKHLHFGVVRGELDLRGYVKTEKELEGWYDPLEWLGLKGKVEN